MHRFTAKFTALALGLVALAMSFATPVSAQGTAVGTVEFSKGVVSAQTSGDTARLLGATAKVFETDRIETASRSFAIVLFDDGSRITLRPNTVFHVEQLNAAKGSESALFRLAKGGFRVLTGLISKASGGVFKVETPVATIGVRGTEFDARLCTGEENCQGTASGGDDVPVAILVSKGGTVTLAGASGERTPDLGASIYEGDTVSAATGSWGVLVFSDGSRVTVQPESQFIIESYSYNQDQPAQSNLLVRVLVGSLRALTGAIARIAPDKYRFVTDDGTIGVRGTGFDLADVGPTFISVWDSCVDASTSVASLAVCEGQSAIMRSGADAPELVNTVPDVFNNQPGPRPDQIEQGAADAGMAAFGDASRLYVAVTEGVVELDNGQAEIQVGRSQYAVVTNAGLQIITDPPTFMLEDALPRPSEINSRVLEMFDLINDGVGNGGSSSGGGSGSGGSNSLECAVQ